MFSTWVLELHRLSPGRGKAGGCSGEQKMWALVFLLMLCALILAGWCWGLLLGHPGVSQCAEVWVLLKSEQYWPIFHPETSNHCLHLPWLYFLIFFFFNPLKLCSSLILTVINTSWILSHKFELLPFLPPLSLCNHWMYSLQGQAWLYSVMTGPLQL